MTRNVVWIDVDDLRPDEASALTRTIGDAALVLAPENALPNSNGVQVTPSARSDDALDRAMRLVDAVFRELRDERPDPTERGASVLETLRYSAMYALAPALSRSDTLQQLVSLGVQRARWVCRVRTAGDVRSASRLVALARDQSLRLELVPLVASDFGTADLRLAAYEWKETWKRLVASARPRPDSIPVGAIVVAEHYPNSAKCVLPVGQLVQRAVPVAWLASRPEVARVMRAGGSAPLELAALARFTSVVGLRGSIRDLPRAWARMRAWRIAEYPQILQSAFAAMYVQEAARARSFLRMYDDAFCEITPRVVLSTTYSSVPGRAAILVARQRGIRTVYLQHGLFPDRFCYSFMCNDEAIVWGEAARRALTRPDSNVERVHVSGSPIYDGLRSRAAEPPRTPHTVAYLASRTGGAVVSEANARRILSDVLDATARLGASLLIKPHPADRSSLFDELPDSVQVLRNVPAADVIAQAAAVVVVSSTTGLEACLMERPLVVHDPRESAADFGDYVTAGAALRSRTSAELELALHSCFSDAAVQRDLAAGRTRLFDEHLNGAHTNATASAASALLGIAAL